MLAFGTAVKVTLACFEIALDHRLTPRSCQVMDWTLDEIDLLFEDRLDLKLVEG